MISILSPIYDLNKKICCLKTKIYKTTDKYFASKVVEFVRFTLFSEVA